MPGEEYRVLIDTDLIPFPLDSVITAVSFQREVVGGGKEDLVAMTGPSWCGPKIEYIVRERTFVAMLDPRDVGRPILCAIGATPARYVPMRMGGMRAVRGG